MGNGANGGDAFYALGKIEVDLAALKASLTKSEDMVKESASKQASFFSKPAGRGGIGWADPRMIFGGGDGGNGGGHGGSGGGGGNGHGFPGLGHGAGEAASSVSHLTRITRELVQGPLLILAPQLGNITGVMASAGRSSRFLGAGFGILLIGAVAASAALGKYLEQVNETLKKQFDLNRALQTGDFERAAGAYDKAAEAVAEYDFNLRQSIEGETLAIRVVAASKIVTQDLLGGREKLTKDAQESKAAWSKLYKDVQIPKDRLEERKFYLDLDKKQIQSWLEMADTQEKVTNGYKALDDTVREAQKIATDKINAEFAAEVKRKGLDKDDADFKMLALARDKKVAQTKFAMFDELENQERAQKTRQKEFATADEEAAQKKIQLDTKRATASAETAMTVARNESEMIKMEQNRMAAFASSVPLIQQEYDHIIDQINRERREDDALYESKKKVLDLRIKGGGIDAFKAQKELAGLDQEREGKADEFRNRRTVAESDAVKKQAADAKAAWEYQKTQVEDYFNWRRQMGDNTGEREVAWQLKVAQSAETGSKEWYSALSKVSEVYEKIRNQAEQTLSFVIQTGSEEMKKHGRKKASLKELEDETKKQEKKDQDLLSRAGRGERVDIDKLQAALGRKRGFEEQHTVGMNAGDLFRNATTPASSKMADAMLTMQQGGEMILSSATQFATATEAFASAVASFASLMAAGMMGGNQVDSSKLGRMMFLENKRGPINQESAS